MATASEIAAAKNALIQSTAGAVPFMNEKGEMSMQKVKVKRYVTGKRPDYAPDSSSDEEETLEVAFVRKSKTTAGVPSSKEPDEEVDSRLRRLREREQEVEGDVVERIARHRRVLGPEVLDEGELEPEDEDDADEESDDSDRDYASRRQMHVVHRMEAEESSSDEEEELDEEEIERRRAMMRERAQGRGGPKEDEELLGVEDDEDVAEKEAVGDEDEEEDSEYEEYTDSEEESGPRLKPVFVARKDRVTVQEKEMEVQKEREIEEMNKLKIEERRKETLRLVEKTNRQELELQAESSVKDANLASVNTDDENDEEEYETWQIRELKRIKRDREQREQIQKELAEAERLRNMTEEERRNELRVNPKVVTNKAVKGRYKFLQRYYHRGVFFMDEEDQIMQRDVAKPTLEDHFDKTVLPKVMQVKNFGRSGRTKYTHLVDQDTTEVDAPWMQDSAIGRKFQANAAGGMKQSFEKPTSSRKAAST
ncbi:microfibrillar-associated protein 1-like [Patiria miniata]|uniref:Micro-fibrillar-associated protein 1 C-terminal domain-containing protein n=1 Tax=Patiria miniata TaxID=46514 RepID=A0A913ZMZ4_PATMI|nr:microfibrillar-associated protein 1-like [Patiria miniata]XP_038053168.1 microfibrillar-associated protein 1-like [Patiria miniata]